MGEPAGEPTNPPFIWPANQSGFLPPQGQDCISPGKTKARDLQRGISFCPCFPGEALATSPEQQAGPVPVSEFLVWPTYGALSLLEEHILGPTPHSGHGPRPHLGASSKEPPAPDAKPSFQD